MNIMLKEVFIRPFKNELWFLLSMWIFSSAPAVWYYLYSGEFLECLDLAVRGLFVSYCVTVVCAVFSELLDKGKIKPVVRDVVFGVFLLLGVINLILDKGQYNICHEPFNYDTVGIILGSNLNESSEFIKTYFTENVVVFVLIAILLSVILFLCRNLICKISEYLIWPIMIIIVGGLIFVGMNNLPCFQMSSRWDSVYLCKTKLFLTREKPVDLTKYRQSLKLTPPPS